MKIYTKTGDKTYTSLIGGKRVKKSNLRLNSYGTIDELHAYIALLKDLIKNIEVSDFLTEIQNKLFIIGTDLACDDNKNSLPKLKTDDIYILEKEIDKISDKLPLLKNFILYGGHTTVSFCHLARTVCRRAERIIVELAEEEKVDELILSYINRLSDYLFVLSRKLGKDLKIKELVWKV